MMSLARLQRVLCLFLLTCLMSVSIKGSESVVGNVYTMTNSPSGNSVIVYDRLSDGTIELAGTVPTGGTGTGAPLASQSSMVLVDNSRWLLVSNAGSNEVSVFSVGPHGLALVNKVASGGVMPYSLTVDKKLVYVLNAGLPGPAGAASNVVGFRLDERGKLSPIPGSTRLLSNSAFVDPAQVSFTPDGDLLMVTERGQDKISVFPVNKKTGLLGALVANTSSGPWPYGFAFGNRNQLFVSEAAAMLPNASSMSSYVVNADGTLTVITGATPTHQTAACWVVVGNGGRFTYTTNAFSSSISGFSIGNGGQLSLLNADGRTGVTPGVFPIDVDFSKEGRFLYTLALKPIQLPPLPLIVAPALASFRVGSDGSLTPLENLSVPFDIAAGLAIR